MTEALVPSYLSGQWLTPDNPSRVADVHDASTGEVVALVSAEGLDIAGAIDYARSIGREGLQKLTFHERALKLKELAIYLQDHREELYELANQAGANKRDNFVDIDGGISTMFTFSSKGRREMPNSTVMPDGEAEVFSKDGSFIGRHIYTSIPGVAVQINAFNFPVWGMLEKFAPAFIAGVPSIVKPATPTGYISAACVRLMIDSGILPEGSLQLISGSAHDLLDHLDYRDHVAFTGSADTANTLRAHRNVIEGGIQFSAEADSLNAAILGTDVTADSPEFEAFVKAVFGEMTSKAGQKCTAIRRAIVPHALVDATIEALSARLRDKVVVGDPRDASATMGPLVSADQKQDVAKAVEKLKAGGGEVVYGGEEAEGAFFNPTILRFANNRTPAVHDTEAFGPVVSFLGYDSPPRPLSSPPWALVRWLPPLLRMTRSWHASTHSALLPTTAACTSSTAMMRRRLPATALPSRTSSTVARAAPAAAKNWVVCAASCTTCSAPPSRARLITSPPSPASGTAVRACSA